MEFQIPGTEQLKKTLFFPAENLEKKYFPIILNPKLFCFRMQ